MTLTNGANPMEYVTTRLDKGDPLPSDTKLFREWRSTSLPMTDMGYATLIMGDMHKAGARVPIMTKQGYSMQSTIAVIVQEAMDKAVEVYRERRWWKRLERKITGREWP